MHTTILRSLSVACLLSGLFLAPALAEPEPPAEGAAAEEVDPDEAFAKSLVGTSFESELELEGWSTFGGGLVSPPIYVHMFQREDGTSLIVTSKLSSSKTFTVIDALIISKPWKGYSISISCMRGDDFTLRFIGDARGPEESEWWTDVRRAWEIEVVPEPDPDAETTPAPEPADAAATDAPAAPKIEPGKISKANTKGVRCTNDAW